MCESGTPDDALCLVGDCTSATCDPSLYLLSGCGNYFPTDCKLSQDYVSYYKFETETAGSTPDEAGANNGALINNAVVVNNAERGSVLSLDGTGDYVNINNPGNVFDGKNITISAWIYGNTWSNSYPRIIDRGYDDQFAFYIAASESELSWAMDTLTGDIDRANNNNVPISTGQWYHVALVYNGISTITYIDGSIGNTYNWATSGVLDNSNSDMRIGERADAGTTRAFNGLIDDVMVYNRALSSDEVNEIYCGQGGTVGC